MKLTIAGTGYVGLVTGACLADKGHKIICIDVEKDRINQLKRGESPIFEPGLETLLKHNENRLTYTTDVKKAYQQAEVIFICVGTPEKQDGSANLKYVYEVAKEIAENVEKNTIIVIKSTVPIGTHKEIENMVKENLKHKVKIEIVSNPEFLSQGTAIRDTLHAQRIVLGVESKYAEKVMKQIYDDFKQPYIITDRTSAEMIKYASNDYLALKISYINEIANLCEMVGANIEEVTKGMGMDSRIGKQFLKAGIGYGGSCFPKDTKALSWLANFNNYEIKTIKAAIQVNEQQKLRLIKKAKKYYDSFEGLTIAVLGLTFKPNTDDLREAPSLENIPILLEDGAKIQAYDPMGMDHYKKIYPTEIRYCTSIKETLEGADICFIFTEWEEIKQMDVRLLESQMKTPIVIDGRNCFSLENMKNRKIVYESIGRKAIINFNLKNKE